MLSCHLRVWRQLLMLKPCFLRETIFIPYLFLLPFSASGKVEGWHPNGDKRYQKISEINQSSGSLNVLPALRVQYFGMITVAEAPTR